MAELKSGLVLDEGEKLIMEIEAELWATSANPLAKAQAEASADRRTTNVFFVFMAVYYTKTAAGTQRHLSARSGIPSCCSPAC